MNIDVNIAMDSIPEQGGPITALKPFTDIEKSSWPAGQIFIAEDQKDLIKKVPQWANQGSSIEEFIQTNFIGTPIDYIKLIHQYITLGAKHFMLYFPDLPNLQQLKLFAKKVIQKL